MWDWKDERSFPQIAIISTHEWGRKINSKSQGWKNNLYIKAYYARKVIEAKNLETKRLKKKLDIVRNTSTNLSKWVNETQEELIKYCNLN